jgi:transcriptional/translational regulatory protein YebC/TACO1
LRLRSYAHTLLLLQVICSPSDLPELSAALGARHSVHSATSALIPSGPPLRFRAAPVDGEPAEEVDEDEEASGYVDEEDIERLDRLMENLEEEADCQRIWSNLDGWPAR